MSNNRTELVELEVSNDEMKEMLDTNETPVAGKPVAKKRVMSRIWAALLFVAPVALLCVLPTLFFVGQASGYAIYGENTLLDAIMAIVNQFAGKDGIASFYEKIANAPAAFDGYELAFLPLLNNAGFVGKIYSVGFYAIPVAIVLNLIFALVAVFSGKAAPTMARAIAFVNLVVFGSYLVAVLGLGKYYGIEVEYLSMPVYVLGGIVALSLIFYLVYSFIKTRGKGALNFVLLVLSVAFVASYVYAYFFVEGPRLVLNVLYASEEVKLIGSLAIKGKLVKYAALAVGGFGVLTLFFGALRVSTKKGYTFDLIRYIINFIVAGVVVYFSFTNEFFKELDFMKWNLFAIISAAVALVQIVICCITISCLKKKKKAAKAAVTEAEEPVAEEEEEVTVEAVRYEFTAEKAALEEVAQEPETVEEIVEEPVVEEVAEEPETVEEIVEEPVAAPAPVVCGYDYYNSKNFDPFIASLNDTERQQFTELFILKTRGELKNLPDYEVGGNNKEFFRRIFIFLGQYREIIPSGLLAKMYNFSSK